MPDRFTKSERESFFLDFPLPRCKIHPLTERGFTYVPSPQRLQAGRADGDIARTRMLELSRKPDEGTLFNKGE
jgi:hypothetical protein